MFIEKTDAEAENLATWCEELSYLKRHWYWERLRAGREGDDRGWDGWMASPTQWTWVCVNSGSWWWTGRPGVLRFMGSQRVGQDWMTELNKSEPAKWRDVQSRVQRELSSVLFLGSGQCLPDTSVCPSTRNLTRTLGPEIILGFLFHRHGLLNHWPYDWIQSLAPLPSPEVKFFITGL